MLLALVVLALAGSSDAELRIAVHAGASWSGFLSGWGDLDTPNYLGARVPAAERQCSTACRFVSAEDLPDGLASAHAVLIELQPFQWRPGMPIPLPVKPEGQLWILFGVEQENYFPLAKQASFQSLIDANATLQQDSQVPITMFCNWGGKADLKALPRVRNNSTRNVFFMASNCDRGGAEHRTLYVQQLMQHIQVDSYGSCLRNSEPGFEIPKRFSEFGEAMARKIDVCSNALASVLFLL
jgi:hypothetical protein